MTKLTFQIRKAKDGYRWRLIARNGKIVAESGEAYSTRAKLANELDKIIIAIQRSEFVVNDLTVEVMITDDSQLNL